MPQRVPFNRLVPITPSDTATFAPTEAVWVGSTGTLVVVMEDGSTATITGVPDGALLPIRVVGVMEATDADDIVAMYTI